MFNVSISGSERIYAEDDRPVSCWEEGDKLFCVAPNLVCTDVYQTGGGGDNISAAGLSIQIKWCHKLAMYQITYIAKL